jgi:type II secretory pathway component PulC
MSSRYFVYNILVCFVILLLAVGNYEIWSHPTSLSMGTGVASGNSEIKNEAPPTTTTEQAMSVQSHLLISEKNIFSPERTEFPVPAAVTAEAPNPIVRPQIVLYGVAIGEDCQSATILNPARALRKEERETRIVKIGAKIEEYTLAKILPDRITMESNGDTFEVLLDDSGNPKRKVQARAKTAPAMTANLQPSPVPSMGEVSNPIPAQGPVEKPRAPVQTRAATLLPFNKYTYQSFSSPAPRGGRNLPGLPAQDPPGKWTMRF